MEYGFFDKELKVNIPDMFELMSQEKLKEIYQVEFRPQIVFATSDYLCHMTISRTKSELTKEMLPDLVSGLKNGIRRANPSFHFYEEKIVMGKYIDYGWFDYQGFSLNGKLYHVNAAVSVNRKMYIITFFCPLEKKDDYKPIFLEIYKDMRDTSRYELLHN